MKHEGNGTNGRHIILAGCAYEEFEKTVRAFHGALAPGVIIGGFMVDLACRNLPFEGLYDALCETAKCLPDAIQLLTPCSTGNRWLKVIDVGRYALALYNKRSGEGVRVCLDWTKLEKWPEIKEWYLKLAPKKEQNLDVLLGRIKEAGHSMCTVQQIVIEQRFLQKTPSSPIAICPLCKEAYRLADGPICLGCRGGALPYASRLGAPKPFFIADAAN